MSDASLRWVDEQGTERKVLLEAVETLLGRHSDAEIRFSSKRVSRHHAKIKKTVHGYLLLDLVSQFGTCVNGKPVEHCVLRDGDRIWLSDYQVEILFSQEGNKAGEETTLSSASTESPAPQSLTQILTFEYRAEMASSMKTRRRLENERRLVESELDLAHEVQDGLLPRSLPDHGHVRIRAFSKPTRQVGGDFYDFLQTETGEFVSILGDVSGKGVAAALLSSLILGFVQAHLRTGSTLKRTIDELNRFMCERGSGHFATMFVCTLNQQGHGRFISAGHNPVYLFRRSEGRIDELASNNTIVGAFPAVHYETTELKLDEGDVLLLYSDGLTEAENPQGDVLGEEAIRKIVFREAARGAIHLEHALLEAVQEFSGGHNQIDDITIAIIERASLPA